MDDEERETDTEGDVASDDDASSAENNPDLDQEREQPGGAEYARLSILLAKIAMVRTMKSTSLSPRCSDLIHQPSRSMALLLIPRTQIMALR